VPTRKQRRRQQKLRRHEYEEVYVDAEGNVVEADEAEQPEPSRRRNGRTAAQPARASKRAPARTGRTIQPPSVRRALKRGLIFGPIMFILISILPGGDEITLLARVVNTLMLLAIFLPFSYIMDTVTYRLWLRRTGQAAPTRGKST
jgi:hypothetical protein